MDTLRGQSTTRLRAWVLNARYDKPDPSPFAWSERCGALARLLDARAPDLLFYQELEPRQRDGLARDGKRGLAFPPSEVPFAATGQCVGVAWNPNRFALLESATLEGPGKGAQSVALLRLAGGSVLLCISVHWPYRDAEGRRACAARLVEFLGRRGFLAPGGRAGKLLDGIVVGGDFNAAVATPERERLAGSGFHDALAGARGESRMSYHAFGGAAFDEAVGLYVLGEEARLDVVDHAWLLSSEGRFLSDHRLLEATLQGGVSPSGST